MRCRIDKVKTLSSRRVDEMFFLFRQYYQNICRVSFDSDLRRKNFVIILEDDATEELSGFSTLELYRTTYEGQVIRVVFSGDTVIAPKFWGSQRLPITFGSLMLTIHDQERITPLYWLLTSKGHRTYRYLPLFFRDYHPCPDQISKDRTILLVDFLARKKFGTAYDAAAGVVRAAANGQCLHPNLAVIGRRRSAHDPHTAFFSSTQSELRERRRTCLLNPLSTGEFEAVHWSSARDANGTNLMTIAARIANHIWKHSCCFDAVQWSRARGQLETTQAGHLLRLLRRQAQTRFGADHGFAEIRSVKDYRERVPIRNYDDYHVYLAAVFDGKTAVLTQDRVMRLEPTSGTSSGSKFIPYTWGLHRDFQAGLHPWIWNLYNRRIFGRITQHPPRLM